MIQKGGDHLNISDTGCILIIVQDSGDGVEGVTRVYTKKL